MNIPSTEKARVLANAGLEPDSAVVPIRKIFRKKQDFSAAGVQGKAIRCLPERVYHNGMITVNAINQVCIDPGYYQPFDGLFAIGDAAFMS